MNGLAFVQSAKAQFVYYKSLAEKTFDQVPDEGLRWQYNEESNSIMTIVKHLSGNMLSRWTDIFTTDGEKEWRDRDSEFENDITTRAEMMDRWNTGWNKLFEALDSLKEEDLERIIYIRNMGQTVYDAINRQLAHYPHHIGQILYIGKMVVGKDWKTLSIAKGGSKKFNEKRFSVEKGVRSYLDDLK